MVSKDFRGKLWRITWKFLLSKRILTLCNGPSKNLGKPYLRSTRPCSCHGWGWTLVTGFVYPQPVRPLPWAWVFLPLWILSPWVCSRSRSPSGSRTMIPLMLELETAGMVMKPLDSHHCHAQHPAVTAVALVILVPAEPAFVLVATSSIRFAAVPASTALAAKLKGADLIASSDRGLTSSKPPEHANLGKGSCDKASDSAWKFSQEVKSGDTYIGWLPSMSAMSVGSKDSLSVPTDKKIYNWAGTRWRTLRQITKQKRMISFAYGLQAEFEPHYL